MLILFINSIGPKYVNVMMIFGITLIWTLKAWDGFLMLGCKIAGKLLWERVGDLDDESL